MDIFTAVRDLDLPEGEYIVLGSGIMHALDIRESADIDLLVSRAVWDELNARGWEYRIVEIEGRPRPKFISGIVEAYKDFWYGGKWPDPAGFIANAVVIQGIPFLPLEVLLDVKRTMGRSKDLEDVRLIEAYLAR